MKRHLLEAADLDRADATLVLDTAVQIDAAALRALGEACADAAVPQTGPLPGAYARSALSVLERRLAAGELSLRRALAELDTRVVELDERLLVNANTPADL